MWWPIITLSIHACFMQLLVTLKFTHLREIAVVFLLSQFGVRSRLCRILSFYRNSKVTTDAGHCRSISDALLHTSFLHFFLSDFPVTKHLTVSCLPLADPHHFPPRWAQVFHVSVRFCQHLVQLFGSSASEDTKLYYSITVFGLGTVGV